MQRDTVMVVMRKMRKNKIGRKEDSRNQKGSQTRGSDSGISRVSREET